MTDTVALAIVAAFQAVTTGWIHYQVNKNSCGGAKCIQTLTAIKKNDALQSKSDIGGV